MLLAAALPGGVEKLIAAAGRRLQLEIVEGHPPPRFFFFFASAASWADVASFAVA
jgi:hypothetical protein